LNERFGLGVETFSQNLMGAPLATIEQILDGHVSL
jgi:hypothetical protein